MSENKVTDAQAIFHQLNREVWIVTADAGAAADGLPQRRGGLVATWAGPASIDPERPTAIVALAVNHFTHELVRRSGAFALHLIRPDQIELAWRFALSSGRDRDKLADLAHHTGVTGSPILDDCLAWLDCRVYDTYTSGDRSYVWADVVAAGQAELAGQAAAGQASTVAQVTAATPPGAGEPLREQQLFALAGEERKATLFQRMMADVAAQRPLYDTWRRSLNGGVASD